MNRKRSRLAQSAVALLLVLLLAAAPMSALAYTAWINNSSGRIYSKSGSSDTLSRGTSVSVKSISGSWAIISYHGKYGLTKLKYLTSKSAKTGYISAATPLYKSASTSSGKYGTLPVGTKVGVVGVNGSFYQVTNHSHSVYGYVSKKCVSKSKPKVVAAIPQKAASSSAKAPTVPTSGSKAERVVSIAKQLLGRPYSAKADPPKSFDCSRFVRYCFSQVGVSLKATAKAQGYDSSFRRIDYSDVQAGDILCFNTNSKDGDLSDHTGICIGHGEFIHASSSAKKVITSSYTSGYYRNCFSWGLRK